MSHLFLYRLRSLMHSFQEDDEEKEDVNGQESKKLDPEEVLRKRNRAPQAIIKIRSKISLDSQKN